MLHFWLGSWLLVAAQVIKAWDNESEGIVTLRQGRFAGLVSPSRRSVVYYGIPYAQPPIGKLRFRNPVPLKCDRESSNFKKIIDAKKLPETCIQGSVDPNDSGGAGTESCLHLNVYNSITGSSGFKPVLVYFHGGAYIYGNPASLPFDDWVESHSDIIIVSVYYRLSVFGNLAGFKEDDKEEDKDSDGKAGFNVGLEDQREALRWVQSNIVAFGGDSNQVTISGQSSGAASVLLHLIARETVPKEQLFHQAIAQSIYRTPVVNNADRTEMFDWFSARVGCTGNKRINCLRSKPTRTLIEASNAAYFHNSTWLFQPIISSPSIPQYPTSYLLTNPPRPIPLLIGHTSNETLFSTSDLARQIRSIYPRLSDTSISLLDKVYMKGKWKSELVRVKTIGGEVLNRCAPSLLTTTYTEESGKIWVYRFNEPNPTDGTGLVQHSADNWWMFQGSNPGPNGTFTLTPFTTASQIKFNSELIAYWVSFIKTGNPNTFKLSASPTWPSSSGNNSILGEKGIQRLVLQQTSSYTEEQSDYEEERCTVIFKLSEEMQN